MTPTQTPESFTPLRRAAARLGVPAAWLRAEAIEGRIPHLKIGRRLLFKVEEVERAPVERSQKRKGAADGE